MDWEGPLEAMFAGLETQARRLRLRSQVEDLGQVRQVRQVGDGVARVEGLREAMLDEIVVFSNGARGQVFDLDRDMAGCVLYGPEDGIQAGSPVFRTGQPPTMPVGEAVLGRVVDALGQPQDGLGPLDVTEERPVDQEAPGPLQRQPVREPLFTGVKAVDAAIPIGLGQRELILGDRATGKTSLALDAILNQRDSGVICIYVSIGRKRASLVEIVEELRRDDALKHTALVMADA
jgi:F-type H+-transporting ATPase subunit alpha